MDLKSQLEPVIAGFIADICDKIYNELSTAATKQMQDYVRTQLKEVDFQEGIAQAIQQLARENLNGNLFADNSIPCRAFRSFF